MSLWLVGFVSPGVGPGSDSALDFRNSVNVHPILSSELGEQEEHSRCLFA